MIDASDVVLGRLAVTAATLLRGKHKPTFAPHVDTGDFVIVVNASKIALSGNKATTKLAYRHSGRPGGLKSVPYGELLENDPRQAVERAVCAGLQPAEHPRVEGRAGGRHPDAATMALEQTDAALLLDDGQLPADGRLGECQFVGSGTEVQVPRHRLEGAQVAGGNRAGA